MRHWIYLHKDDAKKKKKNPDNDVIITFIAKQ